MSMCSFLLGWLSATVAALEPCYSPPAIQIHGGYLAGMEMVKTIQQICWSGVLLLDPEQSINTSSRGRQIVVF
jgi:hypothetical protein